MTVMVSTDGAVRDRREREETLAELDGAWGRCRAEVEALRATHHGGVEAALAVRREAVDTAWESYQHEIRTPRAPGPARRSERVADARRRYNEDVAIAAGTFEASKAAALETFVSALEEICAGYEGTIDKAFRTAVGLDDPAEG